MFSLQPKGPEWEKDTVHFVPPENWETYDIPRAIKQHMEYEWSLSSYTNECGEENSIKVKVTSKLVQTRNCTQLINFNFNKLKITWVLRFPLWTWSRRSSYSSIWRILFSLIERVERCTVGGVKGWHMHLEFGFCPGQTRSYILFLPRAMVPYRACLTLCYQDYYKKLTIALL